jgi:uncharacterized protein (TIGR03083 family)
MVEKVTKKEVVDAITKSRERWDQLIAQVAREDMEKSGFCGKWSFKDVLSHITWYERQVAGVLRARAFVGSDLWRMPTLERNEIIYGQYKDRDPDEVLADYQAVHAELMENLEPLDDDDLNEPSHFPGMPSDWQPWQIIADNTYKHYDGHTPHAKAFLGL